MIDYRDINVGHVFCGLGGGARGFQRGQARLGNLVARFRCVGGIDHDAAALRDFAQLAGVPGTRLDLFTREQFIAFHGHAPPAGWREATPADVRAAFTARPHIVFLSAPCKGFSGLLSEKISRGDKYQALNGLTLRGVWLVLEAFKDDPVELILFENVPRIAVRGRPLLDRIDALFHAHGYYTADPGESFHDCGALGGLPQSRRRFLKVARHRRVPNFLYQPVKLPLRGVGEVLDKLPLPLSGLGGPMHRVPSLQWKTWVRLAFVRAGSDWRSLNDLKVEDGVLRDFGIAPERGWFNGAYGVTPWQDPAATVTSNGLPSGGHHAVADPRLEQSPHGGSLGVKDWGEPSCTVAGRSWPHNNAFAVSDPRVDGHPKSVQLGVRPWDTPAGVVTGKMVAGGGPHAVADPRIAGTPYNHVYRIVPWDCAAPSITSANGGTAAAVADPRFDWHAGASSSKVRVTPFDAPTRCVTGSQQVASGAQAVADPRPVFARDGREHYLTAGHYGVVAYDAPSRAVTGTGQHDNGAWSVADPRPALPGPAEQLVCVIRALDGTWHRPFTTLELAALQSLFDPDELTFGPEAYWDLDGMSDSAKRERIGNAVPSDSAAALAGVFGRCLLGAWSDERFAVSSEPVWVRPFAIGLSTAQAEVTA